MHKVTVLYDNYSPSPGFKTAWGFSCLVDGKILFDTGGDFDRIAAVLKALGVDKVVASHCTGKKAIQLLGMDSF